ncbi:hypothetical protein AMS68_000728 [Peltaster fructicola]|uniref:Phospholipase n=1 Tax=Peltaster fructicola TaxID=286661 RepID=A0A6H0XKQ6_9PEZI|nr:hypothetical protein AMS68_000728 [Peltaster fructicola]
MANGQLQSTAFPATPSHQPRATLDPPSIHVDSAIDSFPFEAVPGSVGPAPTTELIEENLRPDADVEQSPRPRGRRRKPRQSSERWAIGSKRIGDAGQSPMQKTGDWETDEEGTADTPRSGSFFGKLKSMASTSGQGRSQSAAPSPATDHGVLSPQSERSEPDHLMESEAAMELDADADEDSDEAISSTPRPRRRRQMNRSTDATGSTPSTPMTSRFASFIRDYQNRPAGLKRRATMSDVGEDVARGGVSEDEGKDRIRSALRRGLENARGIGSNVRRQGDETPNERRPMTFRKLTGRGADGSSPFRLRADRANTTNAQIWRQVKTGIKLFGQRKRDERIRVDYQKSAQLMAEIAAGAPAALVLASFFQRDEHGRRRIPALLEQLKITIPSSQTNENKAGDRHVIFKIDLEYGSGSARLNWTIYRTLRDFVNLHIKYKVQGQTERIKQFRGEDKSKARIPHFPKSAFPYARGARGLFDGLEDEDDNDEQPETTQPASAERPTHRNRRISSFHLTRRLSSSQHIEVSSAAQQEQNERQRQGYADRQRKKLEIYLQRMIRWVIFRPDSNRLCQFLELSALSIRLAAENGYQGKQGLLTIASRQNREIRRAALLGPGGFADRHKPRWTLVRHSYIVIVDGPESVTPYDVFLVDSDFSTDKLKKHTKEESAHDRAVKATDTTTYTKHHIIRLNNSERKLKLVARTERQWLQFQESIEHMVSDSVWAKKQRFASFAPVRDNVWCRWLVDGRDHMWQVSRAIDNAKDFIYIHDWWLSPELYMRRPAAISQKWRLDRLLQRKAEEGVKIFVIVYRNIESAIPIDSEYTKWALLDLHENIIVQRSPNQFRQNQFFWAHHEKLVVIDNMMAFCGGVDLCFGRWDDSCHSLTDDKLTGFELDHNIPRDSEHCQVWPGKDYSNPRVQDFYALDRPYEEMYDRTKVPRMPWHDISMQIVGQPARDLGRHFVQRWNYILRQRIPSRPTPVLMPPPEYEHPELEQLGMTGTCQVQMLRSCSPWSIGTPNKVEHSIMNAYCALIQESDHFVYIENQFFISSCVVEGTPIHNKIGDALVERIIRAHEAGDKWQACLVIPLMPGFQNSVDAQDGTSVRLIMQCQFRSICRGDSSMFGRLRARNIDPSDYIRFYSLRQWGKIGPRKCLTTEQLYIHAKCMVVDDRHAIIGSANINERSMLGSRDSEVAAMITDMKMIPSTMAGEPYMVGDFPHTLRMRLMREHIGIDVDALYRKERMEQERHEQDAEMARIYRDDSTTPENDKSHPSPLSALDRQESAARIEDARVKRAEHQKLADTAEKEAMLDAEHGKKSDKHKKPSHELQHDLDVAGFGLDNERQLEAAGEIGYRDSYVDAHGHEVLRKDVRAYNRTEELQVRRIMEDQEAEKQAAATLPPPWPTERKDTIQMGLPIRSQLPELPLLDDTDIGGPPARTGSKLSSRTALLSTIRQPHITESCMKDPLISDFYDRIWHQVAENNTKIYRQVFRCQPDSEVLDWKTYDRYNEYNERFMQSQGLGASRPKTPKDAPDTSGPPGSSVTEGSIAGGSIATAVHAEAVKPKGLFNGLMGKLRHGSKVSDDAPQTNGLSEKQDVLPASPGSAASSVPTAVPSPDARPLDEKDGFKQFDANDEKAVQHPPEPDGGHPERRRTVQIVDYASGGADAGASSTNLAPQQQNSQRTRKRAATKTQGRAQPEEVMPKEDAEELLKMVQGSLVLWPYDWLEKEERNGNWLYSIDTLAPLEIYE